MYNTPPMIEVKTASLKRDKLNVIPIDKTRSAVAFYDGGRLKVIDDLCPHMGGPISQGKFCPKNRKIECPWHGYRFSTEDLELKENPNEEIWVRHLAPEKADTYKTPRYRLRELKCQVQGETLAIQDRP